MERGQKTLITGAIDARRIMGRMLLPQKAAVILTAVCYLLQGKTFMQLRRRFPAFNYVMIAHDGGKDDNFVSII